MDRAISNILMIRPIAFEYNHETAESNSFIQNKNLLKPQEQALACFDNFVKLLKENKVNVEVFQDSANPKTPDSLFPNNWVSFHNDGKVVLYPMKAVNRRAERRYEIIELLKKKYEINRTLDLSYLEKEDIFLEGTGSLVLDRIHKIAYMCRSNRSCEKGLVAWLQLFPDYKSFVFSAKDKSGKDIYHSNVMMSMGQKYVLICLEVIHDEMERNVLLNSFMANKKEVIILTLNQIYSFAGNMLEVKNADGDLLLVMSSTAYHSLKPNQINSLEKYVKLIHVDLSPIEQISGGSARCMMAEINLELKVSNH